MKKVSRYTVTRREVLKTGAMGLIGAGIPDEIFGDDTKTKPDKLATEFIQPPDSARPWVYWYFMDGNLTREGMTADLDAMKSAGLGGAIYLEVGVGIERGPVEFMSTPWQELLGHAFSHADQLGLQIALAAGPGWCGTGGPWVPPEESMQHLVSSETRVTGPEKFNAQLLRPLPRTPFFGEATLPPELHKAWKEFYIDVLVLAFPTPAGNLRIADVDEKALYTRGSYSSQIPGPYSSRPWVRPFLPTAATYSRLPSEECITSHKIIDITDKLASDGRLLWDVPSGDWTIMRFGRTITGQTTRPAPKPGLGLETDKFSRTAIDAHFEAYIASLLGKVGQPKNPGHGLTTLHFDSWEMSSQNWSAKFREEFLRRRGYDLLHFLPTFSGYVVDDSEMSERFLWDIRQTAQELVVENQAIRLRELGQRHGLQLSLEPYDLNPCSDLSLGSAADVPMGEFWSKDWGIPTEFSVVEATSVGHTLGHRVIGSEAFTSGMEELWHQYPGSMKEQGDWALCAGINRFVFHRFQAQPWPNRSPGMTMGPHGGYGVHWDRTQTWWDMVPAYHLYLSRCQQMLRRGLFVADILYLAAEGAPNVFLPPPSAFRHGRLADRREYNFDGCSSDALITRASVKNGCIVFPDGMSYRLLVLPQVETMTPTLLRKIAKLVEDGASVLGAPPRKSPSLVDYPRCDQEVQELAMKLWGNGITTSRKVGRGLVLYDLEAVHRSDANLLARSKWIWSSEETPSSTLPISKRYFSRSFNIEDAQKIESAQAAMTSSWSFELFVNGQSIETGHDYKKIQRVDVTSLLISGSNKLSVVASIGKDHSTRPGLIGGVTIRFNDGHSETIDTDRQWTSSMTDQGPQHSAMELGAFDASPWKLDESSLQADTIYPSYRVTANILSRMGIMPDFDGGEGIRYIHRRDDAEDIYFIANKENHTQAVTCQFRVSGRQPEWWNPVTGERRVLPQFEETDGRTSIPVCLDAFESGFVLFREPKAKRKKVGQNFPKPKAVMTITDSWEVSFDPKWGGPPRAFFSSLEDWSKRPEPGIRYYSGKAVYRTTFDCKKDLSKQSYSISLGLVKNLAWVKLNGRDLGIVWCDPWQISLPDGVLQQRNNQLEIMVANLWINRLIGDSALPQEKRLTWVSGDNPFHTNSPLQESGLLGPVTIQAVDETYSG
jgi:hypothetical protein